MDERTASTSATPEAVVARAVEEAAALVEDGRLGDAFEMLHETLEEHGESPPLLCWLGALARDLDAHGPAYDFFRRCLALNPTDPVILSTAGTGLARFDDPDAETALRSAAVMAPELFLTRLNYGVYLAREGMVDLALPELAAARDLNPEDPIPVIELAYAALITDDLAEATLALERAAEMLPDDGWVIGTLALVQWMDGDEESAIVSLAQARAAVPTDAEVAAVSALVHAAMDQTDIAEGILAEIDVIPESAVVTGHYGDEIEDAVAAGSEAARRTLREILPGIMRDRYAQRG